MTSDFDPIASEYCALVRRSIAFWGQDVDFYARRKADALVDLAQRRLGEAVQTRALDVGCGIGLTDEHLVSHFAELHGVDVAKSAVRQATRRNPGAHYRTYAGERLPYPDARFDLAFAICVVHHLPPAEWVSFTQELSRVVRPNGLVVLFEHNPRNPLTRAAVDRCEFDRDAVLLGRRRATHVVEAAGLRVIERRYIVFLPIRGSRIARLERLLAWLPLGAQHYVAARRPSL